MSYREALEAAGAKVLVFQEFGSYQGDWWAKVQLGDKLGWINGGYGSCSSCDAFEAEFGWGDGQTINGKYVYEADPEHPNHEAYMAKLKAFGGEYLDRIVSQDEAVKEASRNLDWDTDAEEMVKFLRDNAVTVPNGDGISEARTV
jgi:hypothetical protein